MKVLKACARCTPVRRQPRLMRPDRDTARCGRCRSETRWEQMPRAEVEVFRQRLDRAIAALSEESC